MSKLSGLHLLSTAAGAPPAKGDLVELSGETARHLLRVLRARSGDSLGLTDGRGARLIAGVRETDREANRLTALIDTVEMQPSPPSLTAVLPLIRRERMEWAVEKLAEIGVRRIIPCVFERCDVSRGSWKRERLEQRLREGCRQSDNPWLPRLEPECDFTQLAATEFDTQAMLLIGMQGGGKLPSFNASAGEPPVAMLVVGPEGDFSPAELEVMRGVPNHHPVNLAEHTLRAETALILLAAAVRRRYSDNDSD